MKKLAIGSDHAGYALRLEIEDYLREKGYELIVVGTDSPESCDYPIFGEKAARLVASGEADGGVLICGTGLGISLAANKVPGIRACVCSEPVTAGLSRAHNNSNMIAFGSRIVGSELAKAIVDTWLTTPFDGERHQRRVDLIMAIEKK